MWIFLLPLPKLEERNIGGIEGNLLEQRDRNGLRDEEWRQAQWEAHLGLLPARKFISFSEALDMVTTCMLCPCQSHCQTGTDCPLGWPLSLGRQEEVSSDEEAALVERGAGDTRGDGGKHLAEAGHPGQWCLPGHSCLQTGPCSRASHLQHCAYWGMFANFITQEVC